MLETSRKLATSATYSGFLLDLCAIGWKAEKLLSHVLMPDEKAMLVGVFGYTCAHEIFLLPSSNY